MAVYTDFFLASDEELLKALPLRVQPLIEQGSTNSMEWKPVRPFSKKTLSVGEFPADEECKAINHFEHVSSKNLTTDRLADLCAILGGNSDEFSAKISRPALMSPGEYPHGGLFQLPFEFVRALADIPKSRLGEITKTWLGHRDAKSTVTELARKSVDRGLNMYLWIIV